MSALSALLWYWRILPARHQGHLDHLRARARHARTRGPRGHGQHLPGPDRSAAAGAPLPRAHDAVRTAAGDDRRHGDDRRVGHGDLLRHARRADARRARPAHHQVHHVGARGHPVRAPDDSRRQRQLAGAGKAAAQSTRARWTRSRAAPPTASTSISTSSPSSSWPSRSWRCSTASIALSPGSRRRAAHLGTYCRLGVLAHRLAHGGALVRSPERRHRCSASRLCSTNSSRTCRLQEMPAMRCPQHSKLIALYAVCGFANLSSVGIQISGIGAMCARAAQRPGTPWIPRLAGGHAGLMHVRRRGRHRARNGRSANGQALLLLLDHERGKIHRVAAGQPQLRRAWHAHAALHGEDRLTATAVAFIRASASSARRCTSIPSSICGAR